MDRWRLVSNVLRRGLANGHSVWSVCQSVWIMRMPQIAVMSQRQGNSQRGVGTACHSKAGSHNQGCHWRKRLESCIEKERGAERSKVKGSMKKKGSRQQREREEWHATPRDTEQGRTRARIQGGKRKRKGVRELERCDIFTLRIFRSFSKRGQRRIIKWRSECKIYTNLVYRIWIYLILKHMEMWMRKSVCVMKTANMIFKNRIIERERNRECNKAGREKLQDRLQ